MDVVHIAEAQPGCGGLAESLPKALSGRGHGVTVISPLLAGTAPEAHTLARRLSKVEVTLDGKQYVCDLYDSRTPGGVSRLFVAHELFEGSPTLGSAEEGNATVALRAGLFARAAVSLASSGDVPCDVLQAEGWIGGLALMHATQGQLAGALRVLCLSDLDGGVFLDAHEAALGLDTAGIAPEMRTGGQVHVLRGGLLAGQRLAFSCAAMASPLPAELAPVREHVSDHLCAIPFGIEAAHHDPATDTHLVAHYTPTDLDGKRRCKTHLQRAQALPPRNDIPLIGVVVQDGDAGGADLFVEAASAILRNDCQVVVLCDGATATWEQLNALSERFADRLAVRRWSDGLAHELLGASDFWLLPARRDFDGRGAMHAHRYGALPIAHRAGAVAEVVVDCDARLETGSGLLYDVPSAASLLGATQRACAAFQERAALIALQARVMGTDHSWALRAERYERMYEAALATHAA